MPPDVFYPDQGLGLDNLGAEAKKVCVDCTVREDCLDYAVRHNEDSGIWGGLGEDRRRHVRRQYLTSIVEDDPWIYLNALAEETSEIGRQFGTNTEERPWTDRRRCDSCHEWVPAGRHPVNRNGPNAQCGVASTYNKGCRCRLCGLAKTIDQRRTRTAARRGVLLARPGKVADG